MRPPTCREASSRLSLLLDGRLAPGDADRIGEHLKDCGRCREEYEALAVLRKALEALPTPEPRADALARIRAALAPRRVRQPVVVLGVAAVALLIALSYTGGRTRTGKRGGHRGPPLQERAVTVEADPCVRPARPRMVAEGPVPRVRPGRRHVARVGADPRVRPHRVAPSPGGSIVIVCLSAPAPDVAALPAVEVQPIVLPVEPGTASYCAEIDPGTGELGSRLAVSRTIGDDLSVESLSIAYEPSLAHLPDTRTEEEDTSHVRPIPEDAGPAVGPMPRLVGDPMPSGLV